MIRTSTPGTAFYLGVNGGYSWGRSRTAASFFNSVTGVAIVPPAGLVTSNSFDLDGGVEGDSDAAAACHHQATAIRDW
jgi:hypothetical protein